MSIRIPFTGNYSDLSNNDGYQFEFRCERCGNGFRSGFQRDMAATGQKFVQGLGRLVGYGAMYRVTSAADHLHVQTPRGTVHLRVLPRFVVPGPAEVAGGFVAPMPGVVLDVRVSAGQSVSAGETLVVLEAMKMEHHMAAPADGVVAEVRVAAGEQVENGGAPDPASPQLPRTSGGGTTHIAPPGARA